MHSYIIDTICNVCHEQTSINCADCQKEQHYKSRRRKENEQFETEPDETQF